MAMEESWSAVRVDGMVHATFWVAEWPRMEVRSDFLAPLLLGSARSTLSVVMEPLGPDIAARKVEASRTADLADAKYQKTYLTLGQVGLRAEHSGHKSRPCWLFVQPSGFHAVTHDGGEGTDREVLVRIESKDRGAV